MCMHIHVQEGWGGMCICVCTFMCKKAGEECTYVYAHSCARRLGRNMHMCMHIHVQEGWGEYAYVYAHSCARRLGRNVHMCMHTYPRIANHVIT